MNFARLMVLLVLLIFSHDALAQQQYFEFHSDPQMNLHHLLYHAARNERLAQERLRGRVRLEPSDRELPLTEGERATWDGALDAYAEYARVDLLFDPALAEVKQMIAAGTAVGGESEKVPLLQSLAEAMPVYRRYFWQRHQAENAAFISRLQEDVARHGAALVSALENIYESEWGEEPVRVDIVKYANWAGAYTTHGPNHVVMASSDARHGGTLALEILFHEAGHTKPLGRNLLELSRAAAAKAGVDEGRLWHSYIFYASGEAVRRVVDETHRPYAEVNGLWERGSMAEHKVLLDEHFGKGSLQSQFERMHAARADAGE